MRIGIDLRSVLEPYPSGVTLYTTELVQALLALPDRTDTLCLFTSGWNVPLDRIKPFLNYPHVSWQHLQRPNKLAAIGFTPAMDKVLGGVDVLFVPNWNFVSVSSSCPVVLTVHDCAVQFYPQLLSRKRRLWHQLVRPHYQVQRAKRVIAVSEVTRQDVMTQFGVAPDKIVTIHSAAPRPVTPVVVPNLPERYVVAIGAGELRKNLATVISVDPPCPIIVIGEKGNYGYVSPGEKWYILQHAQALIYDSLYEGFGFPPLEAFQAGVPVIASFAGALPEVCGDAALYVNPYSRSDLAAALNTLLTDQPLRQRLMAAGKLQVQKFSWEATARHTLQVLQQSA